MSNQCWTETTCDTCGEVERRQGNVAGNPEGWIHLKWYAADLKEGHQFLDLCPACTKEVREHLIPKAT